MAGPSWLVDGNRFASKIKCASGTCDLGKVKWKSNPTRSCPSCHYIIDNSDIIQEWPGLPRGVKFDPSDQEIIQHLLAKSNVEDEKPHPFIGEFIPTVEEEGGICYTHPCNLPGVKQDGNASHFFHRAVKAYNTGTRKRRKINGDNVGDVRWHKTGRTKPVLVNGVQKGCKKIMVLYVSSAKGGKPDKTNWVMHQYHLGTEEDEKDGEFVISKVFHQQQPLRQSEKSGVGSPIDDIVAKVDPVTPKSVTPQPHRGEKRVDPTAEDLLSCIDFAVQDHDMRYADEVREPEVSKSSDDDNSAWENSSNQALDHDNTALEAPTNQSVDDNNEGENDENVWWEGESQYILNSQQLVEGLSLCDDFLQSQSPNRDMPKRSILSEYTHLKPEDLKKDLEDCQNLDPANINIDTPPDIRLSQLDFGSQDSYLAWGGSKLCD